jgi:hypothetical protein
MNKNVLKKLSNIESKVELAEVKVDLALMDDLMKATTALNNESKKSDQLRKDIAVSSFNLKQSKKALLNQINGLDSAINNILEISNKIETASKELGVTPGDAVTVAKRAIDNVEISRRADIKTFDLNNI